MILINKYIEEAEKARKKISNELSHDITHIDFQNALGKQLGYSPEDSVKIPNHELDAIKMIEMLRDYDWKIPESTQQIILDESIIPSSLPTRLDEQQIKNKGEVWVIHKNDKDPFPSNPHAHNYESGYKLHLGSGQLFDNKNNDLGQRISKKDLNTIRSKVRNITLPIMTR